MRRIKAAVMILGAAGCAMTLVGAPVDLPFTDSFDPAINTNWAFQGTAGVVTAGVYKTGTGDTQSMYSEENAALPVGPGYSNVWFSFYAQMTPFTSDDDEPEVDATTAAAFFMTTNAMIHAYDETNFVNLASVVTTNGWHGFAVQLDAHNKTWNLYHKATNAAHTALLSPLNPSPMKMNDDFSASVITQIVASGKTYLDHVSLTRAIQEATNTPANVATESVGDDLILTGSTSGMSLRYFGTTGTLDGPFGDALAARLGGAGARVIFTSAGSVAVREIDPNGAWSGGDFTITPGTGMFISTLGTGTTASAVFTASYGTPFTHTGSGNVAVSEGWNLLAIPFTATSKSIVGGAPQDSFEDAITPANGDLIFVPSGSSWSRLRRVDGQWLTGFGATPANVSFPNGVGFFYMRANGNGATSFDYGDL